MQFRARAGYSGCNLRGEPSGGERGRRFEALSGSIEDGRRGRFDHGAEYQALWATIWATPDRARIGDGLD